MINFYRDVFKRRSYILSPLNDLAVATAKQKKGEKKKPRVAFKMLKIHLHAFKEAKQMIMTEAMLSFPDFTKPFHLYTNASDIQVGATLVQDGKPLGFYTRKLNKAQQSYTSLAPNCAWLLDNPLLSGLKSSQKCAQLGVRFFLRPSALSLK